MATKKFEKLRIKYVRSEKDVKLEQKTKYGSVVRKQIKKPMVQMFQETVGSDFSSGATLAAAGDNHYLNNTSLAGVSVKPYGVDGLAEGNSSLIDQNVDKAEESLSGTINYYGSSTIIKMLCLRSNRVAPVLCPAFLFWLLTF